MGQRWRKETPCKAENASNSPAIFQPCNRAVGAERLRASLPGAPQLCGGAALCSRAPSVPPPALLASGARNRKPRHPTRCCPTGSQLTQNSRCFVPDHPGGSSERSAQLCPAVPSCAQPCAVRFAPGAQRCAADANSPQLRLHHPNVSVTSPQDDFLKIDSAALPVPLGRPAPHQDSDHHRHGHQHQETQKDAETDLGFLRATGFLLLGSRYDAESVVGHEVPRRSPGRSWRGGWWRLAGWEERARRARQMHFPLSLACFFSAPLTPPPAPLKFRGHSTNKA